MQNNLPQVYNSVDYSQFELPPDYKGKRIARRLNTPFIAVLLFIFSALVCGGLIAYRYYFDKQTVLNYKKPTVYALYVIKNNTVDYSTDMKNKGYAGWQNDDMIIATYYHKQENAYFALQDMLHIYPSMAIHNISYDSLVVDVDTIDSGNDYLKIYDYFYVRLPLTLNNTAQELQDLSTSVDSISNKLKNNIQELSTYIELSKTNTNTQIQLLTQKLSLAKIALSELMSKKITSHSLRLASCEMFFN